MQCRAFGRGLVCRRSAPAGLNGETVLNAEGLEIGNSGLFQGDKGGRWLDLRGERGSCSQRTGLHEIA
jgi:hypothetical protein